MNESETSEPERTDETGDLNSALCYDKEAIDDPLWFFAHVVDNLPVNVVCKNSEGHFTYVNRAFASLMDRPAEEFIGKSDFDFSPHELASKYVTDDRWVMETRRAFRGVEMTQTATDEKQFFEVRKTPLLDRNGEVIGIEAVFWNVTRQKEAEAAAEHERFLLHALMDNVPDSIYFKDIDSRFVRISKGQARKFGVTDPDDILGKTDADIFSAEHAEQARRDELEIMRTEKPLLSKVEKETWPDGPDTWCSTTKMPLRDQDGDVVGTFGISRDITELVLAEEALRKAKMAADAANRAKSDFLANMSHEIRTPMNAVLGITELLLDTDLTATQRDYLGMVLSSGESLLSLINDILDFSKIEAGKLELSPSQFDLRDSLGDTVRVLGLRAHAKDLELAFSVDADVPDCLIGDIGRLQQIVINLVGNAIKFTKAGEVVMNVSLHSCDEETAVIHVCVSDTGIGIPASKLEMIFREFEQADSSTTRDFGGSGLGLAISSRLVELMGGEIHVESDEGKGSTFSFTTEFQLVAESALAARSSPPVIEGTKALIVDDNDTNRLILNDMLLNWGMEPFLASSADQALEILYTARDQGDSIPIVLTDVQMPSQDGFKLCEVIRQDETLSCVPIVMLTSGLREGDIQESRSLGVTCHLIKPLKQSEVFQAIISALGSELTNDQKVVEPFKEAGILSRPLSVLLVEDNIVNQKLALGVLAQHHHEVVVANNGLEAIEIWRESQFDLILMDVQMPEMDGFQATQEIRKLEKQRGDHTPIIAMTARAMEQDRTACIAAGMDDYLAKPIHIKDLHVKMEGIVAANEQRKTSSHQIDWETATANVNGDLGLLKSLVEVLRNDAPRLMKKIETAIVETDAAELKLNSHTLKGSVLFLGNVELTKPAQAAGRPR